MRYGVALAAPIRRGLAGAGRACHVHFGPFVVVNRRGAR
jgi:hypothetical protein